MNAPGLTHQWPFTLPEAQISLPLRGECARRRSNSAGDSSTRLRMPKTSMISSACSAAGNACKAGRPVPSVLGDLAEVEPPLGGSNAGPIGNQPTAPRGRCGLASFGQAPGPRTRVFQFHIEDARCTTAARAAPSNGNAETPAKMGGICWRASCLKYNQSMIGPNAPSPTMRLAAAMGLENTLAAPTMLSDTAAANAARSTARRSMSRQSLAVHSCSAITRGGKPPTTPSSMA